MGGPTEDEKEAVKKRFAEMKAKNAKMLHPKEQITEEKRKKQEERRKEREALDARIIRERESNPERYAAWLRKREKDALREILRQEDEAILKRNATTWRDYTLRGLVYFTNGDLKKAYDEFHTAFSMNARDVVSLSFLKALTEKFTESYFKPILDDTVLNNKKLEVSPVYLEYLFYNDLLYLYIGLGKEAGWFDDELFDWLPERFRIFAKTAPAVTIGSSWPSPFLIKIANTIEKYSLQQREYTLNKDHWSFSMLSKFSNFLMKAGLKDETPNEFIARMVKIFIEMEENKHSNE